MLFDYAAYIKCLFLSGILKDFKFRIKSKIIKDLIQDLKYKGVQYSSAHSLPTDQTYGTHWHSDGIFIGVPNFPFSAGIDTWYTSQTY